MKKWKIYAIVMGLIAFGSLKELFRILTSDAPDITANRTSLIPIAIFVTGVFIFLTVWFWRKSSDHNPL
ncbi:hypothetical protein [Chitinophaga dinghuensis]|uniref:hypothetical protein n=1 Tax=Chitinophaga dinghuensis TaxID=1539050 RepID=UPI000DB996F5|nr:hypothetical protein [Chitinophaga dinghuensis]